MRGRLVALSVLAGIVVPAVRSAATAEAGSGSIGIRLVDVPADSRDDSRARSYIVDRIAPGATIRRRVEITNTSRSTALVALYPAAAGLRKRDVRVRARARPKRAVELDVSESSRTALAAGSQDTRNGDDQGAEGGLGGRALCGRLGRGIRRGTRPQAA